MKENIEVFEDILDSLVDRLGEDGIRKYTADTTVMLINYIESVKSWHVSVAVAEFENNPDVIKLRALVDEYRNLWIEQRGLEYEQEVSK